MNMFTAAVDAVREFMHNPREPLHIAVLAPAESMPRVRQRVTQELCVLFATRILRRDARSLVLVALNSERCEVHFGGEACAGAALALLFDANTLPRDALLALHAVPRVFYSGNGVDGMPPHWLLARAA